MPKTDHLNHKPDAKAIEQIEDLRKKIISLEAHLIEVMPETSGRELSIAKTKLEEFRMWAVKGLVMPHPAEEID